MPGFQIVWNRAAMAYRNASLTKSIRSCPSKHLVADEKRRGAEYAAVLSLLRGGLKRVFEE
jgi:hypothetical protein